MTHDEIEAGERLQGLIRSSRYETVADFARTARKSPSLLRKQIRGERTITMAAARTYGRLLGRTPEYILNGKQFNHPAEMPSIIDARNLALCEVPLLGCCDIEQWGSIASGSFPVSEKTISAPNEEAAAKRAVAYLVEETGMEINTKESIDRGDHVFIDPDAKVRPGDIVVALADGFDHVILRKYKVKQIGEGGKPCFDLVAANDSQPSVIDAHLKGVQIIGPVVAVYRIIKRQL